MKKVIILIVIALSILSCSGNVISEQQFIDNINSFDSTATYSAMNIDNYKVSFVINSHDSLFIYHVERSLTSDAIWLSKKPLDKVK